MIQENWMYVYDKKITFRNLIKYWNFISILIEFFFFEWKLKKNSIKNIFTNDQKKIIKFNKFILFYDRDVYR